LLNLHIVQDILDKFVNCRLVVLVGGETRGMQEIDDWPLLQQRHVFYCLFPRYKSFPKPLPTRWPYSFVNATLTKCISFANALTLWRAGKSRVISDLVSKLRIAVKLFTPIAEALTLSESVKLFKYKGNSAGEFEMCLNWVQKVLGGTNDGWFLRCLTEYQSRVLMFSVKL
jgi:hypothetical protein